MGSEEETDEEEGEESEAFLALPRVDEHAFWTRWFGARPLRFLCTWLARKLRVDVHDSMNTYCRGEDDFKSQCDVFATWFETPRRKDLVYCWRRLREDVPAQPASRDISGGR